MSSTAPLLFKVSEQVEIEFALEDRIVKLELLLATDRTQQQSFWQNRIDSAYSALETFRKVQSA